MIATTQIHYVVPEDLLDVDDEYFARTEDGEFYARMQLTLHSDTDLHVKFLLYVQLSEADWTALRAGTAKFVTGRVVEELPARFGAYHKFYPGKVQHTVGHAHTRLGRDGLNLIYEALAEQEAA